jgi:hypothetical protein
MPSTTLGARRSARWSPALVACGLFSLLLSAIAVAPAHAQTSATTLSGYVMNYAGEFVPGATVTLYSMPAHTPAGPTATSDANGEWSMDTGAGKFAIQATAPGYTFSEQTVFATEYQTGITFIMRPLGARDTLPLVATVTGRVLSKNNVPLGGMNIVAHDRFDTGVRQVAPPTTFNRTLTNEDGTYSLAVPAGVVWLTLKTGAVWGYQLNPITFSAGQTVSGADFVAAVSVLPRLAFPSPTAEATLAPTATPVQAVSPVVGMPATGQGPGPGPWAVLAALGALATLAGSALALRGRGARG